METEIKLNGTALTQEREIPVFRGSLFDGRQRCLNQTRFNKFYGIEERALAAPVRTYQNMKRIEIEPLGTLDALVIANFDGDDHRPLYDTATVLRLPIYFQRSDMRAISGRIFSIMGIVVLGVMPLALLAHPNINGVWVLNKVRSNFAGEPVIETGSITINDREHNIYISRTFNYDGEKGGFDFNFTTDGQENSTIKKGVSFKSKAKWEGDALKVKTTRDGLTTMEHFSLTGEGTLILMVDRPNHQSETLLFQRQQ